MHKPYTWVVTSVLLAILPARLVSAQSTPVTRPPVVGRRISTVLHRLKDPTIALTTREQLVDSLVVVVLASRSDDPGSIHEGVDALGMLLEVASTEKPGDKGPDLLPGLQSIALSNARGMQWSALRAIAVLPDIARSLAALAGIAKDPRPVALFAVVEINKMGEPGVRVLRQLYAQGLVTNPEAKDQLQGLLKP